MAGRHVVDNARADPLPKKPQPLAAAVLFEVTGRREAPGRAEMIGGQGTNESFVFVGSGAPQTVVDVEDDEWPWVHLPEGVEEEHAIGPTGDRDAELGSGEAEPSERSCHRRQHVSR